MSNLDSIKDKLRDSSSNFASQSGDLAKRVFNDAVQNKGQSTLQWFRDNYPMAVGVPLNVYSSIKFNNWAELQDEALEAAKSSSKLSRGVTKGKKAVGQIADLLGDASDYFDLIDPYGYNSEITRSDFDTPAAMLFDNYQLQRARWLEELARSQGDTPAEPNTGLQKTLINPPDVKNLPKTSATVQKLDTDYSQYVRYYTIPRLGREDLGLADCMYYNLQDPTSPANFMLSTNSCPAEYQAFYQEYYKKNHPSTQIQDCVASDYIDASQYMEDLRNNKVQDKAYKIPLTKDESRQWFDCTQDSDGKFYKSRYRLEYQKAQNGGNACDPPLVEKKECSPVDCTLSPWIDLQQSTLENTVYAKNSEDAWSNCRTSSLCSDLKSKIDLGSALESDKRLYSAYDCPKVASGEVHQSRYRNVTEYPKWGGKECAPLAEYRFDRCGSENAPVDCKLSDPKPLFSDAIWYIYRLESGDISDLSAYKDEILDIAKGYLDTMATFASSDDLSGVENPCGWINGLEQAGRAVCKNFLYLKSRSVLSDVVRVFSAVGLGVTFVQQRNLRTNFSVCQPIGVSGLCNYWQATKSMNPERNNYCSAYGNQKTKIMVRDILSSSRNGGQQCGELLVEVPCSD